MNRMRDAYIVLAAGTLLLTALALHGAQQYDLKKSGPNHVHGRSRHADTAQGI